MNLERPARDLAALDSVSAELAMLDDIAAGHEAHATPENTARAYAADWRQFAAWCERHDLPALPADPSTVRLYVANLSVTLTRTHAPFSVATIRRHLAAISRVHFDHGHPAGFARHPDIARVVRGLARQRQERPQGRRPLMLHDVQTLIGDMRHDEWPEGVAAARDTLVLLLGFAGALRRSEVVMLRTSDLRLVPGDGLHVRIRASKSDKDSQGVVVGLPYGHNPLTCPVCAWARWEGSVIAADDGRQAAMRKVFATGEPAGWDHLCRTPETEQLLRDVPDRPLITAVTKSGTVHDRPISGAAANEILLRRLARAGYDPGPYGFHSLRAGFVTQARNADASSRAVRRQTRHSTDAMVDVYDREHRPLAGNAVTALGL